MGEERGYFCRSLIKNNLQSNVAVRTIREAEAELSRMITAGATLAHAIRHGREDHELELVALCAPSPHTGRAADIRRYLHERKGPEFDRWQSAFESTNHLLDQRWKVIALSVEGIHEYGAFGKAVRVEDAERSLDGAA